jgi:exodeoxyribonuclease VII small subunit
MARRSAPPPAESEASPSSEQPFDQRLERLEALVRELESGNLGLEEAISRYEQGVQLLKGCHSTLERFRARVEELSAADGALTPFGADPDGAALAAAEEEDPSTPGERP